MAASSRRPSSGDEGAAPRTRHDSSARAWVYVLPCLDEAILKVGFSRDPLQRLRAFRRRHFDFFDLDLAFLVETDRVVEARAVERRLATLVAAHNAPAPSQVARAAAGHTEWYRGAYPALLAVAETLSVREGYLLHRPARGWLRQRFLADRALLFDWSLVQLDALRFAAAAGEQALATTIAAVLVDTLDEFAALQLPWQDWVPVAVVDWRAARSGGDASAAG